MYVCVYIYIYIYTCISPSAPGSLYMATCQTMFGLRSRWRYDNDNNDNDNDNDNDTYGWFNDNM